MRAMNWAPVLAGNIWTVEKTWDLPFGWENFGNDMKNIAVKY